MSHNTHLSVVLVALAFTPAQARAVDLEQIDLVHDPAAGHVDQAELTELVLDGNGDEAFTEAFEDGDELFETRFNALDGVGANVGGGQRFTRLPRADKRGPGEWATHTPARATGPNAVSCNSCHNLPVDDGAGLTSSNVHRDPQHSGNMARFIQRNTPHVFGMGAVQRLAEEQTARLWAIRDGALRAACETHSTVTRRLSVRGIDYGEVRATPRNGTPCSTADLSRVTGVDRDLIVRPFQWKGSRPTVRDFNRDAAHNELGMQGVELVGAGADGDADGVRDELTVGDLTALAVYLAAQPRPTSKLELARLRQIPALAQADVDAIGRGSSTFRDVGCADCHVPQMLVDDPIFREPSRSAAYRDARFPSGDDPLEHGLSPDAAVRFDLTRDQPDNQLTDSSGRVVFRLGSFRRDFRGRAQVDLFGDLKRHDMGAELAEGIDEIGTGAATFMTENLWGVGSTGPYLHDGRATTLTEAILLHGGEAQRSRDAYAALSAARQSDVVAFLDNLVLFKLEPAQEAESAATATTTSSPTRFRIRHVPR